MNNIVYVGCDNGVSGTIGIITPDGEQILAMPIKTEQKQTKKKGNISRLNFDLFCAILDAYPFSFVGFERPLSTPRCSTPHYLLSGYTRLN